MPACVGFIGTERDYGTGTTLTDAQAAARYELSAKIGRECLWLNQVHGTAVATWEGVPGVPLPTADILIVDGRDASGVAPAAAVVTADCVPIALWSRTEPVWAVVHAGRKGIESGVVPRALEALEQRGIGDISAAIGPAICRSCYQVDPGTAAHFRAVRSMAASEDRYLDLVSSVRSDLDGTVSTISQVAECTYERRRWHSYRRHPQAGRNATVMWCQPGCDMPKLSTGIWLSLT